MFKRIEHIGVAVNSISELSSLFEQLLGTEVYKQENVNSEGVTTSFLKIGESKIELLESTGEKQSDAIDRFLKKRGPGIHHIAFEVDNIVTEILRLKEAGFTFIDETPRKGADNKLIAFIHPKSANGILVELCQEITKDD